MIGLLLIENPQSAHAAERKKSEKIAEQLRKERELAEKKAKELEKSQQTQLASIQKEKEKREQLIQEEKKKREELEKKLAALQDENKNRGNNSSFKIKLPPAFSSFVICLFNLFTGLLTVSL